MVLNVQKYSMSDIPRMGGGGGGWGARSICGTSTKYTTLGRIGLRGERILFFGPNTNMNNIRNQNFDQIQIGIIFVFSERANTNTNNIRAQIFG